MRRFSLTREEWEEIEAEKLAPYAMLSRASRGRVHPEEEHPFRSAFQRDRDRILHTTAFRRLEYKTQVFVTYEGDYYRTRLTHTLETAQMVRTLARALRANEDLAEAITLAHDLGHPPFGHAGEEALHRLMKPYGGFNHNAQSLRIVERLERRYPDFPGLNLTWEVREGLAKHFTEYDRPAPAAFQPELAPTLEAQLASVADEIAFNTHDLDDGLRAEIIPWQALRELPLDNRAEEIWGEGPSELSRHRLIRHLVDVLATDVVCTTAQRLEALKPGSTQELRNIGHTVANFSAEMVAFNRQVRAFLGGRLYRHYRVVRMTVKAKRVVRELFEGYLVEPDQLPLPVRARMAEEGPARVVCDYIAGMTDRFALAEHAKLFDPRERV